MADQPVSTTVTGPQKPEVKRPFAMSLLIILADIGFLFLLFSGIVLMCCGTFVGGFRSFEFILNFFQIFLIIYGLLGLVILHFLWKGYNWARIVIVILAALGVAGSILCIFLLQASAAIFALIFKALVFLYFLLDKGVIAYCNR